LYNLEVAYFFGATLYIVSDGALNSTHSLTHSPVKRIENAKVFSKYS